MSLGIDCCGRVADTLARAFPIMNALLISLSSVVMLFLASCASRSAFTPDGPTTVGMPAKLSDRERGFITQIDSALRQQGLVPVRHGKGDLELDFRISSGPIHVSTLLALSEGKTVLLAAKGRKGGVPFIGRSDLAQQSFDEAFTEFQAGLSQAVSQRGTSSLPTDSGSNPEIPSDYMLPVY